MRGSSFLDAFSQKNLGTSWEHIRFVVWTPLKNISQLGWWHSQLIWKQSNMFQTTNQYIWIWIYKYSEIFHSTTIFRWYFHGHGHFGRSEIAIASGFPPPARRRVSRPGPAASFSKLPPAGDNSRSQIEIYKTSMISWDFTVISWDL